MCVGSRMAERKNKAGGIPNLCEVAAQKNLYEYDPCEQKEREKERDKCIQISIFKYAERYHAHRYKFVSVLDLPSQCVKQNYFI